MSTVHYGEIHLKAQLLADMLELLMILLPEEDSCFLDSRDVEIFALELISSHRSRKGRKGAP